MFRVRTTVETKEHARMMAKALVENKVAVSVHIREVEVICAYEGNIVDNIEYELDILTNTTQDLYDKLKYYHTYKVPEYLVDEVITIYSLEEWCNNWCENK